MKMKKIGVVTPIYNEEENLLSFYKRVTQVFAEIPAYDYEILFIDNCSTDNSRVMIEDLCKSDSHIKAIFNIRNYGFNNSVYHGLINSAGDCTFLVNCDMQDPPEMLIQFVKEWERGYKVVLGIKRKSDENRFMVARRKFYYKVVKLLSEQKQVLFHTGFGLYDQQFIQMLRSLDEPAPYLKELVSDFAFKTKEVFYDQRRRTHGTGSTKLYTLYDDAMTGLTQSSKKMLRMATFGGLILGFCSVLLALMQFVLKLTHPDWFAGGIASIAVGLFLLSAVQLFFIGILGEYVLTINAKVSKRAAVYEERRINFL